MSLSENEWVNQSNDEVFLQDKVDLESLSAKLLNSAQKTQAQLKEATIGVSLSVHTLAKKVGSDEQPDNHLNDEMNDNFKATFNFNYQESIAHNSASSAKWLWAVAALASNSSDSLEPYAIPTFVSSDNEAAGKLIDFAGGIDAINSFTRKLNIAREDWNLCSWNYGRDRRATNCGTTRNQFTSKGGVTFLNRLITKQVGIPTAKADKVISWAKLSPKSGTGGWLPSLLPNAIKNLVSHKAGWIPSPIGVNTVNDIALVPLNNGNKYTIAITIEGGASFSNNYTNLSNLSLEIYNILSQYY